MIKLIPVGILLSAFLLTMASAHAAGQVDHDYPEVGTPFKVIGTDDIYLVGVDHNLHWVADLRALNEAGQELDILWNKLRIVPFSVIADRYTIGAPFLARKILKIQKAYYSDTQYFLPRWNGEEFVLHELSEHRLAPRYGLSYYRNGYWWLKNDLYLEERDWVDDYGSHEDLRKVAHPCRTQIEEHWYCTGWFDLHSPNHWITEGYRTYYSVFSPKTIRGPGKFISEYYAITLVQEPGKNNHWADDHTNIGIFCRATANSVRYYAVIQWPADNVFRPPDPDELTFRFGGDVIHSSDLGVSWYIYGPRGATVWPAPLEEDQEVFRVLSSFGYARFQPGLVTRSGVETFMDKLERGTPDFAVQTDNGPNPRGGLFLSEWDTSGAAMAIASLKERCERLPKPTSAYPRPTLTPVPRLTPTAVAEPTATPQPTAATEVAVVVTSTATPSSSAPRSYVPDPAAAPQGKTTHWERYDRWVEGGFAIRVRSEDRTASLAFRCEPERDAARWVAIVETSFAVEPTSVVTYSVPDTGGLYPRAGNDISWHVRSTGLGLYVTGVPAEHFFRQVESDASDPREDLPVYLSVDGVSIEFDVDWLQSALPSHDFGRPGCPVSRLS